MRRRIAVALLVPPPQAIEIDGIRRALGDTMLGRVDPHVTLIPPINVSDEQLAEAMAVVEEAAIATPALDLWLGPVTTFGPDSPVRYLAVEPDGPVTALAEACRRGPLDRPRQHDFVPHVTVDMTGSPTGPTADPAVDLLAGYRVTVHIDHVTVLEQRGGDTGHHWEPFIGYRLRRGAPGA